LQIGKYHLQDPEGREYSEIEVYDDVVKYKLIGRSSLNLTIKEAEHYQKLFDSHSKKKEPIHVMYHQISDEEGVLNKIVTHNNKPIAKLIDDKKFLLSDAEIKYYQEILNQPYKETHTCNQ